MRTHCLLVSLAVSALIAVANAVPDKCTTDVAGVTDGSSVKMPLFALLPGEREYKGQSRSKRNEKWENILSEVGGSQSDIIGVIVTACDSDEPPLVDAKYGHILRTGAADSTATVGVVLFYSLNKVRSGYPRVHPKTSLSYAAVQPVVIILPGPSQSSNAYPYAREPNDEFNNDYTYRVSNRGNVWSSRSYLPVAHQNIFN